MRRDWRYAVVLVGYCAGWLPWFADIDRQMYFFYAVPMAPFLIMGIALDTGRYRSSPHLQPRAAHPRADRMSMYLALAITNFAWLYPILTGTPISQTTWQYEIWLPSWR